MALGANRIVFEFDANSADLQAAIAKAADSLKGLGDVVARQSAASVRSGEQVVASNKKVAGSYEATARAAAAAADRAVASVDAQAAATKRAAEAVAAASGQQAAAAEKQVKAQQATAAAAKASADEQVAASQRIVVGLDEQSLAAIRAGAATRRAAETSALAFGASSSKLTHAGKTIALGLAGVAVASLDMAAKFDAATLRFNTQAGASIKQVGELKKGILAMAGSVGITPLKLADGMYHIVSSMNALIPKAHRSAEELHILRVAAQGAQVGNSDLEGTTYALASAVNALHAPAKDAGKVMGELNSIVGAGDMNMNDLLEALKSGLIPTAQTFGVSFQSVGAALAVMGDMGEKGAMAGTRLRMSLALLGAPSEKAAKLLGAIGLNSHDAMAKTDEMQKILQKAGLRTTQVAADLRQPNGIMFALADLNTHLKNAGLSSQAAGALISDAFGGGRSGAAIQLLEHNLSRVDLKFKQVGEGGKNFGRDWQRYTGTLQYDFRSFTASIASMATTLGEDLTPAAKTVLGDLRDVAHWLEHNKAVLDVLGAAVITFSTVAIGSYLYSKLKGASRLIGELGSDMKRAAGWITGSSAAGSSAAAGGKGGVAQQVAGGLGISGVKGPDPMLPGGAGNPIVVVMEAGDVAGLGSKAAAAGMRAEAGAGAAAGVAVAESRTAGGVILPAGVNAGEAATVTTAAEAEVLGGAGLMASLKAGLPAVLGNAMKGGMIALGGNMAAQFAGSLLGGTAGKAVSGIGGGAATGAGIGMLFGPEGAALGGLAGALVGLSHTIGGGSAGDAFAKLDAQIKQAASADNVARLQQLGLQATSMGHQLQSVGASGSQAFLTMGQKVSTAVANMSDQMAGPLAQALQQVAQYGFPQVSAAMSDTSTTVEQKTATIVTALKRIASDGTRPMAVNARAALDGLRARTTQDLQVMAAQATTQMGIFKTQIEDGSTQAAQTAYGSLANFSGNVTQAMKNGVVSTGDGMRLIIETTNKALRELGQKQLTPIQVAAMKTNVAALQSPGPGGQLHGAATGGYVGSVGERGRDSVLAVLGRGEAVLNHHQQKIANHYIPGGLPSLFAATAGSKHYMASGGYAGGGVVESYGQLEGLWDQAGGPKNMAALMAAIAEAESGGNPRAYNASGASGLWQILGLPFPGNVWDPLTNARMAVSKWRSQGLGAWTTYTSGAYRGFLHGGVPAMAGALGGGAPANIPVPHVNGSGTIAALVQAAMAKATAAANKYLSRATPAGGGGGGAAYAGPAGAGSYAPGQLGNFDGKSVASWIIPELLWARARGWQGTVTSGWRSPTQVVHGKFATAPQGQSEHQFDVYPGGAVDVSDYQQFAAIIRGYPGAQKLIQLGIDPLHFSGTGHAGGGYAEQTDVRRKVPKPAHMHAGISARDLQELSGVGGRLAALIARGASLTDAYSGMSSRFSALEGQGQYLNPDGSVNAAGYALQYADEQQLLGNLQAQLGTYKAEAPLITRTLLKFLGKQSKTGRALKLDTSRIDANKQTIATNRIKEASIRTALLDLDKPVKDRVGTLEDQIKRGGLHYGGLVAAAEAAKKRYTGKNKGERARLTAAVVAAQIAEQTALTPLKEELVNAQAARRKHVQQIKGERFTLKQQLNSVLDDNTRLSNADQGLAGNAKSLRAILSGAGSDGSAVGINATIAALEQAAGKLGVVQWAGGKFAGLDITSPSSGLVYSTETDILSAQNTLQGIAAEAYATPAATADNATEVSLLQQLNLQLSETVALQAAQFGVLNGMMGQAHLVGAFAHGGPILSTGMAMVHRGEYITPDPQGPYGSQLTAGSSAAPVVNVHFHDGARSFADMVDARVTHGIERHAPTVTSYELGRRQRALRNAPGRPPSIITRH